MTEIKQLILDMDGVLWRGETPIAPLPPFFAMLRRLGIRFALATNNATKTPAQYVAKLAKFGVAIDEAQVVTSGGATAGYLGERKPAGSSIYCIGESGLKQLLTEHGFDLLPDEFSPDAVADLVVVGFNRHVVYRQFAVANLHIRAGAEFIGTNPDLTFPSELGQLPGAGSLLAFLQAATGVVPTVIGKPGPIIFEQALARVGGEMATTAMVGDRLGTDIVGGKSAGLQTILLLSGVTSADDLTTSDIQPDYCLADINELAQFLNNDRDDSGITLVRTGSP